MQACFNRGDMNVVPENVVPEELYVIVYIRPIALVVCTETSSGDDVDFSM
jgi:hypothetical protein